jgi:hypothetical protein
MNAKTPCEFSEKIIVQVKEKIELKIKRVIFV